MAVIRLSRCRGHDDGVPELSYEYESGGLEFRSRPAIMTVNRPRLPSETMAESLP